MNEDMSGAQRLGFGTMAIGGQFTGLSDAAAVETLCAALAAGIELIDTAPQYGCGLAESRVGQALRARGPGPLILSTKVGKRTVPNGSGGENQRTRFFPGGHDGEMLFDYSAQGTLAIVEGSLTRLGVSRLDHVLIHDVIRHFHGDDGVHARATEAIAGAVPALRSLQRQGVVGAIGVGLKDVDIAQRFVVEAGIETVLVPGRLTLLDQSALTSGLLATCRKYGARYLAAAPFDSGILARGSQSDATYAYRPAPDDIRLRIKAIEDVCARYEVGLSTVALQYPLRFSAVSHVVTGMRSVAEVAQNVAALSTRLPTELWTDLARLGIPTAD
jgi:D-threo-aldose 1-dehydrogenase